MCWLHFCFQTEKERCSRHPRFTFYTSIGKTKKHTCTKKSPKHTTPQVSSVREKCHKAAIYIYFFPQISQIQKYFVGYISLKYVSGRPGKLAVHWINLCHVLLSCGCESESSFASRRESSKLSIQLFSATVCLLD